MTKEAGIIFKHINGASGRKYVVETHSGGVAFLDYDNDEDLDIYFVNGGDLPGFTSSVPPKNALYRNNGNGTFTDVTDQAGVGGVEQQGKIYGVGCSVGDYNNDGYADIYVTNFGPNQLYRNNGDGTFTDVARKAGVAHPGLGSSSAFGDYDNDGFLDLYVCTYVKLTLNDEKVCTKGGSPLRYYCDPSVYDADPDVLYHNNGDGTFTDVTKQAGVYNTMGKELGVVWGDYDNDGDLDIYVASDRTPNFLYRNNGNKTFTEVGLLTGVAYNEDGRAQAGMGVDLGDYDRDGWLDIFVANFQAEGYTLYHNNKSGAFTDVSSLIGIRTATLPFLGFGTGFFDYDNDGDLDIFAANGHVDDNIALFDPTSSYPQRNQLFMNNRDTSGSVVFTDISLSAGPGLQLKKVSRGTAFGDYDNDGDVDIVIANSNQTADLLRHEGGNTAGHWLIIRLIGTKSNRSGIGARMKVVTGDQIQIDEVRSGSSYASQSDFRLHFGLGSYEKANLVEIRWPSGMVQTLRDVRSNQIITVKEGMEVVEHRHQFKKETR